MSEPLTPEPSRSADAASPPVRTGSIPMADQLLSEQSRAWVEKHPIPTSDTTAPPRASSLPTADQLLSEQSRAWVQKHPIPTGDTEGPIRASSLPLAEQLLSEQSRAWVREHSPSANAVPAIPPLTTESLPAIAGYHIGRRIGRGGMGTVYECRREGLADHLAIKIITSGRYAAEEERRRFMSEIGMLLRLHHPNLSRLRDFGQDGAIAWFVMDFIEGKPFTTWLDDEKPSWEVLAALLGHAARAIAHAHRQGIVHRDLNPSNVMVLADHHPVVMDFGLARDLASDEVLTMSGMTVGTPPYMSPEQTLGTKGMLSPRTDIWGIGGILYHGITGRPPFDGGSNHEIFTAINEVDPVRPRAYACLLYTSPSPRDH
jgi:predicted Ser/Thr protein kinase